MSINGYSHVLVNAMASLRRIEARIEQASSLAGRQSQDAASRDSNRDRDKLAQDVRQTASRLRADYLNSRFDVKL